MDYHSLEIDKKAERDAVLLAKVRYNEQVGSFVGDSLARYEYAESEIVRIAKECAAETGAPDTVVFERLVALTRPDDSAPLVRWADAQLPVTKPTKEDVTKGQGESAPSGGEVDDKANQAWTEEGVITDINDSEPVLDDLSPDKVIDLKSSCVRCKDELNIVEANISTVCKRCTKDLLKVAVGEAAPIPIGNGMYKCSDPNCPFTGDYSAVSQHKHDQQNGVQQPAQPGVTPPVGSSKESFDDRQERLLRQPYDQETEGEGRGGVPCPRCGSNKIWSPTYEDERGGKNRGDLMCANCGAYLNNVDNKYVDTGNRAEWSQGYKNPGSPAGIPGTKPFDQMASVKVAIPGDTGQNPVAPDAKEQPAQADEGLSDAANPSHKFDDVIADLANRAAARQFSQITDDEASQIGERYGIAPDDVKSKAICVTTFGNWTGTNGQVAAGTGDIPEDYTEIDMTGMEGHVDSHEAVVPTDLAVQTVATDLGIEKEDVYNSIKDSYGGELDDEYHTSVSGDQKFYLPSSMVQAKPDTADETMGEATQNAAPLQQQPQPQQ